MKNLLTNWDLMRVLRLVIGITIGIQAIVSGEIFPGIIAIYFLFQAVTNTGCCRTNADIYRSEINKDKNVDFIFEEVRSDKSKS